MVLSPRGRSDESKLTECHNGFPFTLLSALTLALLFLLSPPNSWDDPTSSDSCLKTLSCLICYPHTHLFFSSHAFSPLRSSLSLLLSFTLFDLYVQCKVPETSSFFVDRGMSFFRGLFCAWIKTFKYITSGSFIKTYHRCSQDKEQSLPLKATFKKIAAL